MLQVQESFDSHAEFDDYASDYDAAMGRALAVSGETMEFFAEARIKWLKKCLKQIAVESVMDYGCGIGVAIPFLFDVLSAQSVIAIDPSRRSLEIAERKYGSRNAKFYSPQEYSPRAEVDLVFCNGTFHHVIPSERAPTVDYIFRSLRPGGLFVLSENNPWNPGTLYVMKRCTLDQNAIPLSVRESQRLLKAAGFGVLRIDFLFVFPRVLRALRRFEPLLTKLPIGAQYQIICRKDLHAQGSAAAKPGA